MLPARLTRRTRLTLLALGIALLAALAVAAPDARDGLMYWGPLVLLVGLMLVGVRPDELVARLVRGTSRKPSRRTVRSLGRPRLAATQPLRSGLLIASSLATRPPPAAPSPAT